MYPKARDYAVVGALLAVALLAGCTAPNISLRTHLLKGAAIGLKGPDVGPVVLGNIGLCHGRWHRRRSKQSASDRGDSRPRQE